MALQEVFSSILLLLSIKILLVASHQFTNVELEQGPVSGLKVFPESSSPVYAFLGIPYAKPPKGKYRFAVGVIVFEF